jgi:hypothetical protein
MEGWRSGTACMDNELGNNEVYEIDHVMSIETLARYLHIRKSNVISYAMAENSLKVAS